MEIDKTTNSVVKLYELRLLRCSLASYPTLPWPAEDHNAENYTSLINAVVEHIEKGEYAEALHSEAARLVFNGTDNSDFANTKEGANEFYHRLEHRIAFFLRGSEDYSTESAWLDFLDSGNIHSNFDSDAPYRVVLAMSLGMAALSIFFQCNFTGPCRDFQSFPFCHGSKQDMVIWNEQTEWETWSSQQLMSDGCDLLGKYALPQYFVLAKILLVKTRQMTSEYGNISTIWPKSISWWSSRLLLVQQKVLDERSRSLYDQLQVTMEETLKQFGQVTDVIGYWENKLHEKEVSVIVAAANLEAGIKDHTYGYVDRARQFFKKAEAACGLRLSVTGALGYRTVYQTEAKAQMVLVAAPLNEESGGRSDIVQMDSSLVHNKNKVLEDHDGNGQSSNGYEDNDILLAPRLIEEVKDGGFCTSVEDAGGSSSKIFDTIKQAVILAECLDIKKSTTDDDMQDWQMAPYIEAVGAQNFSHFMVRSLCQILRIRWERKRSRTKQRSMLMMDELAQEVRGCSTAGVDRMHYAYCVDFPTIPALLKEYAELMVSCGIVGDALRIFEELELWDNLIYCYCLLGKKPAAIDLIKERLQHNPEDPRLWCSLGDVTLNDDNYIKALEVSGNRFARAERSLARSAYNRGEYKKSQSHWEAALALNSLHPDGWFALGSAALKARDFDKAIDGFTHAVQLDPDNGEAWNNIACLHMMKKRSKEAFIAFKEALKFRRNSWQMWENYSQVAMDIGNFGQALEAIKMVLDLTNNKRVDLNLLSKLVEEMECRKASAGSLVIATDATDGKLQCSNTMVEIQLNKTTTHQCTDKPNGTMSTSSIDKENYDGIKYSFEAEQMVELIGRILQKIVCSGEGGGEVWGLYARFHKFKGNLVTCSEALLKQVRAYQGSDLKHNEERFKKFAHASVQLCELYVDIALSTGSKREGRWVRQRRCFGWLILLGLVGFAAILRTEIIPSAQPFLPLKTIQSHLYNYVLGGFPQSNALKKNKIAICLVGAARKFELTGPSLLTYVLNRYNNSDVFLHAPFDKDSYKFSVLKDTSSALAAVRIFTPQRINETTFQAEMFTSTGSPNGLQGLLQYFNLVEGCLTMIKSYQVRHNVKYDWIVRTRVDGYWNEPLPPPENYSNKKYIVPPGSQFGGLNDRLGIGNMETSEVALSRISLIPLLYGSGYRGLNSETAFKHQLDVKGVEYMFKTFPFCILSERKYEWPPSRWGVPVASLSSKGHLNGAKCRPCTPALKGIDAMNIIGNLTRSWSWTLATPGLELCDAHDNWEENWEQIFDKVAGPKFSALRQKVKNRALTDCIKDFEAMKQKTGDWDAPPSVTICKKNFQHSR